MAKNIFPRAGNSLLQWSLNFMKCIKANSKLLKLDQENVAEIQSLTAKFQKDFEKTQTAECSKLDVRKKNVSYTALRTGIRKFITLYLDYNPHMNPELRSIMGLSSGTPVHKRTTVPHNRPKLEVKSSVKKVTIRYSDEETNKPGKPNGIRIILYRWGQLDSTPDNPEQLGNVETMTSGPLVINFDENQRGQPVYVSARWVNYAGQKGPWSDIMKVYIA